MNIDLDIVKQMVNKPFKSAILCTTDNHYQELPKNQWYISVEYDVDIMSPKFRYSHTIKDTYFFMNYNDYIQFSREYKLNKIL